MPQGYKNSPATFKRELTIILNNLIGTHCYWYIDDIIVFGRDRSQHDKDFLKSNERILEYGLKINEEKSLYCKESIRFLGYELELNEISPSVERSQGGVEFPIPNTKRKIRNFIRL